MATDFTFRNEGSICLLQPCNDGARAWVNDNLDMDHQTWGSSVVIEPRYVADVLQGIDAAGLTVQS